jgi:hypothetical protein
MSVERTTPGLLQVTRSSGSSQTVIERTGSELPPSIEPATASVDRPYWSVMFPTYNCDEMFEQALRSVLDQDPGPGQMQIAVVDDASPEPRHEAIVRRLAPGRVEVHGRARNLGLARNWNECIARSRGRWVHILHQDDCVLPGFYESLAQASADPAVGAAFCRRAFIDATGRPRGSSELLQPTAGVIPGWLGMIARQQLVHCPAIVVRRDVYERLGGFRPELCFTLDWEMWVRIAHAFPVWYVPAPLACDRIHEASETGRLRHADRDIEDIRRTIKLVQALVPADDRDAVGSALLFTFRQHEIGRTCQAFHRGELREGLTCLHRAFRCDRRLRYSWTALGFYTWALKVGLRKILHTPTPGP